MEDEVPHFRGELWREGGDDIIVLRSLRCSFRLTAELAAEPAPSSVAMRCLLVHTVVTNVGLMATLMDVLHRA